MQLWIAPSAATFTSHAQTFRRQSLGVHGAVLNASAAPTPPAHSPASRRPLSSARAFTYIFSGLPFGFLILVVKCGGGCYLSGRKLVAILVCKVQQAQNNVSSLSLI